MASVVCTRFLLQRSTHGFLFYSRARPTFFRYFKTAPWLLTQPCHPPSTRGHRLSPGEDELYQRTTVSIMQKEQDSGILIQSYGPQGFNIDGNKVFGPCALLPPAIIQWNVGTYKDITEESVSLFHMLEPKLEILVLGTGAKLERINPSVLALLRNKGISVEIQDTANACATFNFLTSERRVAAAGLIPPQVSMALDVTNPME